MSNRIITIEFCEKCNAYRIFVKAAYSQDPWVCMGHTDHGRYVKGEIVCGHEGFRKNRQTMAH